MVKPKVQSKKQKKKGVDFKKIKRKLGRKLPPPKNATNTEIKSKAIILPEQSIASEKTGLTVSKKGLTLKELLQQTSHYNAKVRKDGLIGIRDIFSKCPAELKSHKLAVIEKLRERISDDDKLVRETLYQLLKSVVFPFCKEDYQGSFISLMMSYIFNAMTHMSIDVRLMAFRFMDLVVENYPSSFSLYAEKILQNYEDILRKNQFYLQDKGKLKNVLAGLLHCLSLLSTDRREDSQHKKDVGPPGILHAYLPGAPNHSGYPVLINKLKDLMPVLVSCFRDFVQSTSNTQQLDPQSFDCMLCILESIDLVMRFFASGSNKSQQLLQVSGLANEFEDSIEGQDILPFLLKLFEVFPVSPTHHLSGKGNDKYLNLNIIIAEIFLCANGWLYSSTLLERFLEFITGALSDKVCSGTQAVKPFLEKHIVSLISFIPKLVFQVEEDWRFSILKAFTHVVKCCNPESMLKLACLSAIEDMLDPSKGSQNLFVSDPEEIEITWIRELPSLLIRLREKHPLHSKTVLGLLLRLGQYAPVNSSFAQEYDKMQYQLIEFYCSELEGGDLSFGPFMKLGREAQELSICCIYYFSFVHPLLLNSLAHCCLCHDMEPFILFRIMEVLHSAYRVGRIKISDHISFFITLLSRFEVLPEISSTPENNAISNCGTFKSITRIIGSYLLQLGDDYLVFQILERVILDQLALKPNLENTCALLRVLITLDSRPTRLSEQSIIDLSKSLPRYLTDVVSNFPGNDDESAVPVHRRPSHYYLLPCFFLFRRSHKLLKLVMNSMGSLVKAESRPVSANSSMKFIIQDSRAVCSVIVQMYKDVKMRKILSSCKADMDLISQNMQFFEEINLSLEERHRIRSSFGGLKTVMKSLFTED